MINQKNCVGNFIALMNPMSLHYCNLQRRNSIEFFKPIQKSQNIGLPGQETVKTTNIWEWRCEQYVFQDTAIAMHIEPSSPLENDLSRNNNQLPTGSHQLETIYTKQLQSQGGFVDRCGKT